MFTYSMEADRSGDGIYDCVCMWNVRQPASLNALEVDSLKRGIHMPDMYNILLAGCIC